MNTHPDSHPTEVACEGNPCSRLLDRCVLPKIVTVRYICQHLNFMEYLRPLKYKFWVTTGVFLDGMKGEDDLYGQTVPNPDSRVVLIITTGAHESSHS